MLFFTLIYMYPNPNHVKNVINIVINHVINTKVNNREFLAQPHARTHRSLALHSLLHWKRESRASDRWGHLVCGRVSGVATLKMRDLYF